MICNFTVGEQAGYEFKNPMNIIIDKNGILIALNWQDISIREFKNLSDGDFKIKCFVKGQVAFLLLKFGDLNWMDIAFNVHATDLLKPADLPEIKDGSGYALHIVLISAETNLVELNRLIGLDTNFSRKLREVFLNQLAGDYDKFDYQVTSSNIVQALSTDDLVKMADF